LGGVHAEHAAFGCMRVIAGTHTVDQVAHRDTHAENNLLSRGQEIAVEVNEADAVDIELQPGQMCCIMSGCSMAPA
jgi:ectoine hydroxylase-related dioxygenase (phytanoyl-CoA dioxygenase family)